MTSRSLDWLRLDLRDRYGDAVRAVTVEFAGTKTKVVEEFCLYLVFGCEEARRWTPECDENKRRQKQDAAFNEEARRQAPHLRNFAAFCRRYPDQMGLVQSRMFRDGTMNRRGGFGPGKQPEALARVVEKLADELEVPDGVKSGFWIHRSTIANLDYNRPIEFGRQLDRPEETGLLFELVLLFRIFTATGHPPVLQRGQPMPQSGRPCYRLVCEFLQAALGGFVTEAAEAKNRIHALLKRNPRIQWVPWPDPAPADVAENRIELRFGPNWSSCPIITN